MAPLSEPERRDCWEISEDRYQVRSTIHTSQLPVSRWHEQIASLTGWFTTPTALRCAVIQCARNEARNKASACQILDKALSLMTCVSAPGKLDELAPKAGAFHKTCRVNEYSRTHLEFGGALVQVLKCE